MTEFIIVLNVKISRKIIEQNKWNWTEETRWNCRSKQIEKTIWRRLLPAEADQNEW